MYFAYKEHVAATHKACVKVISEQIFGRTVIALTGAKSCSKKLGQRVLKQYKDVSWVIRKQPECPIEFTSCALCKIVPDFCSVGQPDKDNIKISVKSDIKLDSRFVEKDIILHASGYWELYIDDVGVSLAELHIDKHYDHTRHDIYTICHLVNKLNVCSGKPLTSTCMSNTRCQIHTVTFPDSSKQKSIRSPSCKRVLHFIAINKNTCIPCRTCGRSRNSNEKNSNENSQSKSPKPTTSEFEQILKNHIPDIKAPTLELFTSQFQNCKSTGNRWKDYQGTLRWCLSLWIRSKHAYEDLRKNSGLNLPAESTLRYHKNCTAQNAGLQEENIEWMLKEAERLDIPPHGRAGGLLLDEMAIQPSLSLEREGKFLKMVGYSDMGEVCNSMSSIRKKSNDTKIADHVLQVSFQGFTSFRFSVAHLPNNQATSDQLYYIFFKTVSLLNSYGFHISYTSMDGASSNRTFMKMCFPNGDALQKRMVAKGPNGVGPIVFIMDYSHVMKKIRNSIYSSRCNGIRHLMLPSGHNIVWDHWQDAYKWDRGNPVAIHRRLTDEHIFNLSSSLKMRNHLAEQVLDEDMYNLMSHHQESLGSAGRYLQGTIELLQHTAILCRNMRDSKAMTSYTDKRLSENARVQTWFKEWENWALNRTDCTEKERKSCLMTYQCREDLDSCLIGFDELCRRRFLNADSSGYSIIPATINSDGIENNFCQIRSIHNGANQNPTYAQYKKNMNSVTLLRPLVSKKGNASAGRTPANPVTFTVSKKRASSTLPDQPVKRKPLQDITNRVAGKYIL